MSSSIVILLASFFLSPSLENHLQSVQASVVSGQSESFSECGLIVEGKDCALLFRSDRSGDPAEYLLDEYGGFWPGEHVVVTGTLDMGCSPGCVEADACVRNNTIAVCTTPLQRTPWTEIKRLFR